MSTGRILDLSTTDGPSGPLTVEVLVIGSGCGGATAARVLCERGREVVMLEEGRDMTGRALTQRDGEMYDQLYMDRGGRSTDDLSITVLQGRVLGGGGVINASDVVAMPDEVVRHWQTRYALPHLTPELLAPYRAAALVDLHANPIVDAQLNLNNRILRDGAAKLGVRGEVMHHNREGCAGLGTCLIGCPLDAKRNPRMVSIPRALERGLTIFTRARAVRIDDAGQELKKVTVRALDPKGYHEGRALEIRARVVVVAANPINSVQLLLRSGLGNDHAGRYLSLQPQLPVVARFPDEVRAFRGIPQAYAVTEGERVDEERGLSGFRIEAIMGTPGIVSTMLSAVGPALKEAMRAYPRYAASLLLMPDASTGTIGLKASGRPSITYDHLEEHKARARAAVKLAGRIYLAMGAEQIEVPMARSFIARTERELDGIDDVEFAPCTTPWISAHQQGGMRMAAAEQDGACDPDARVYGTRDVYVLDSSTFPTTASSHTMVPIIMFARYQAEKLAARLGG